MINVSLHRAGSIVYRSLNSLVCVFSSVLKLREEGGSEAWKALLARGRMQEALYEEETMDATGGGGGVRVDQTNQRTHAHLREDWEDLAGN